MAGRNKVPRRLLEIFNHHVDEVSGISLRPDDYVSYFENALGEQWVFIRHRGADVASVFGGDLGWDELEIRDRSPDDVRAELARRGVRVSMIEEVMNFSQSDPLLPGVVLNSEERAWLNLAWWTSSTFKNEEDAVGDVAQALVRDIPSGVRKALDQHPNTAAYRGAIATIAVMIGRAAGIRGLTVAATANLHRAVFRLI